MNLRVEVCERCGVSAPREPTRKRTRSLVPTAQRRRRGPLYTFARISTPSVAYRPGNEFEITVAADTNHPQVGGEVDAVRLEPGKISRPRHSWVKQFLPWVEPPYLPGGRFLMRSQHLTRDGLRWETQLLIGDPTQNSWHKMIAPLPFQPPHHRAHRTQDQNISECGAVPTESQAIH